MMEHCLKLILLGFAAVSTAFADPPMLTQTFSSTDYQYSIHYPADWTVHERGKGTVVFEGNHAPLMVNIQTIYTKQGGGEYASVKDLMNDFYTQVPMHTDDAKFLERKAFTLSEPDGSKRTGEQTSFTFREGGVTFKQWQVMTVTTDGNVFQAWAYRTPVKYFDAYRPVAAAMLASWVFK